MLDFETEFVTGPQKVAVAESLPVDGVDLLLGNDLVFESRTVTPLVVSESPADPPVEIQENVGDEMVYRVYAATQSMAKLADQEERLAREETEVKIERPLPSIAHSCFLYYLVFFFPTDEA
ncbi:hypothetical protein Pcinc_004802 [Petrolisthes cinctipes]|uniref:Uncharacterized protein n=1 Tax=Petrolisthes cinctipes TaxID=88211 RepID=A0AAE1GGC4_PETCI|nr:hypothetical protein Pcinc_004802 [Petrolisthes cinctipes]